MDIDINDYTPEHKYIRLYNNEEDYQNDIYNHTLEEVAYSLVNSDNLVERLDYQPSHRTTNKDNEKLMSYYTEDDIRRWAGLKIIWGYFGWNETDVEVNGETLKGGNFYSVKPMNKVYTVPDLYQYQHLNDFLKYVQVNEYEPNDFSTIKSASYLVNPTGPTSTVFVPQSYCELDSIESINNYLFNITTNTTFEQDVINLNGLTSLDIFPIAPANMAGHVPNDEVRSFNPKVKLAINNCTTLSTDAWVYEAEYSEKQVKENDNNTITINQINAFTNLNSISTSEYITNQIFVPNKSVTYNINSSYVPNDLTSFNGGFVFTSYKPFSEDSLNQYINVDLEDINVKGETLFTFNHPSNSDFNNKVHLNIDNFTGSFTGSIFSSQNYSDRGIDINIQNMVLNCRDLTANSGHIQLALESNDNIHCSNCTLNNVSVATITIPENVTSDLFNIYINGYSTQSINYLYLNLNSNNIPFNTGDNSIYRNKISNYYLSYNSSDIINFEYSSLDNYKLKTVNLNLHCTNDSTFKFPDSTEITIGVYGKDEDIDNITINDNIINAAYISYKSEELNCNKTFTIENIDNYNYGYKIDLEANNLNDIEIYWDAAYEAISKYDEPHSIKLKSITQTDNLKIKTHEDTPRNFYGTISTEGITTVDLTNLNFVAQAGSIFITTIKLTEPVNYKLNGSRYSVDLGDFVDELDADIWRESLLKTNVPNNYNSLTINERFITKLGTTVEELKEYWGTVNVRINEA